MPYITSDAKNEVAVRGPRTPGELNYQITCLIINYAKQNNDYRGFNDILGALEAAKMEFYRRWVVPYEDYKIAVNGDVYPTGES
jgi:hypothetical protein